MMLFVTVMTAQKLDYADGTIMYEDEKINTIDVTLDPKVSTIKDKFEDWMDDNYDVDLDGTKLLFFDADYMSANGVVIPEISDRKIDLKVKVDETTAGMTKLNMFASFGYDNWITEDKHPEEYAALRSIVNEFVRDYLPEYYLDQVEDAEEKVDDLKEDRDDLNDDMQDNEEKIKKLEAENRELTKKLKENQKLIDQSKSRLKAKNKDYKSIKSRVSDRNGK